MKVAAIIKKKGKEKNRWNREKEKSLWIKNMEASNPRTSDHSAEYIKHFYTRQGIENYI